MNVHAFYLCGTQVYPMTQNMLCMLFIYISSIAHHEDNFEGHWLVSLKDSKFTLTSLKV